MTSFSEEWSAACPSGGCSGASSLHVAFSSMYTKNRMFPACSLLFSRPGRMTRTFRPLTSTPGTYCFPVLPSFATSRHVMESGRVRARHLSVWVSICYT
eukprot:31156-Pelagococcus_subviridis.AAC.11